MDTCTIVIDTFYLYDWSLGRYQYQYWYTSIGHTNTSIGMTGVLVDGIHYLEPQKYHPSHHHKGTCNSTPILYLDEDGGTTADC